MSSRLRQPAFANQLREKREAGERVGLAVVSVHHWDCGDFFVERGDVFRVVVPPDMAPAGVDYSILQGLDVLICGTSWPPMYMACRGAMSANAASVWAELADGICRVEHTSWCRAGELIEASGRYPKQVYGSVLRAYRNMMILSGDGIYGTEPFALLRSRMLERLFGSSQMLTS
jgi:hypothetical protein